jgi:predicted phosphodiesterase
MRLAFLADIHSNLPALEAVVRDLHTQAPDAVYLAGDQVNRCPWPNEVMDLLADAGWTGIYGNHDMVVGQIPWGEVQPPFDDRTRFACLWWTAETLTPHHLATLRLLPAELRIDLPGGPPIRLVHGVPGNPFLGLFPETSDARLTEQFDAVEESIVITGHTHRPMARRLGHRWFFNPGSVGLPYNEDPRAQYMILDAEWEQGERIWRPTYRQVAFDHTRLRDAFERSGMLAATGAPGRLHLLTAETGHAYSSDFGFWLSRQPRDLQSNAERAVALYLSHHGPGRWAFQYPNG